MWHATTNVSTAEARSEPFDELPWMLDYGSIVSIYVYADESGSHDSSKVMVISAAGALRVSSGIEIL